MDRLISIITPMYNSEKYIGDTIKSVQSQTYTNFEMLIIDDLSTDSSKKVVEEYMLNDSRIKYYTLEKKEGAAGARNLGTKKAKGRVVAFLDADDLWDPTKLEKMTQFMNDNSYDFVYSDYRFITAEGFATGFLRVSPNKLTFRRLLFNSSSIGCLTAMYDVTSVGKIYVPLLKKRNDVAIWQNILKIGYIGHRYPEVLASHRQVPDSLSRRSGKFSLLKHHHNLYKLNLGMGTIKSSFYSVVNVVFYFYTKLFKTKKSSDLLNKKELNTDNLKTESK